MTLISDEYRELNTKLHETNSGFGGSAWKKVDTIHNDFLKKYNVTECLDYGCGKGTLRVKLKEVYDYRNVTEYDPCVSKFDKRPERTFDGVICSDVLEHIEEEYIENVLKDIYNYSSRLYYLSIGLCLSVKILPDGRNAHILVQPSTWWHEKLVKLGFEIIEVLETEADSTNPKHVFYRVVAKKGTPKDGHPG